MTQITGTENTHKLAIILLLGVFTNIQAAASFEGCIFNDGVGCVECYKRKSIYPSPSCGEPLTDGCLLSGYSREAGDIVCQLCEEGYTVSYGRLKNGTYYSKCTKGGVSENCLYAQAVTGVPFNVCLGCKAGYYSQMFYKPFSNKCVPGKEIKAKPIENCVQGAIVSGGTATCFRCKDGLSRDLLKSECVKRTVTGCLINAFTDANKCRGCDYYNGFFMNKDGDCVKSAAIEN